MTEDPKRPTVLSPRVLEDGRTFVTALLAGVRRARATPPSEQALNLAIDSIHRAAEALYASTGGFSLQFLPDALSLNGVALPFENVESTAVVRQVLESRGVSSLGMKSAPSLAAVRKLVLLFAPQLAVPRDVSSPRLDVRPVYGDGSGPAPVTAPTVRRRDTSVAGVDPAERRTAAVLTYAKLALAVREQRARVEQIRGGTAPSAPPRVHAVRAIDALVDLARDTAPELLRLAALPARAPTAEAHGANTCVLSVLLGYTLGIGRRELLDLGTGALFHGIGLAAAATTMRAEDACASAIHLAAEGDGSRSDELRAVIAGEQGLRPGASDRRRAHVSSRIVAIASAYDRLVNGFAIASGERLHPLDALRRLASDKSGRFDAQLADLLMMILRAYPAGTHVVLDSGETCEVVDYGPRWDRPKLRSTAHANRSVDLMAQDGGRFVETISGTSLFHGVPIARAPAP
ncbi:hypothetical protein L6R52_43125, partial [Myxococcota bacterium]|nr:hypothetical protein [Myxococcota bacterium]